MTGNLELTRGWLPVAAQAITLLVLVLTIDWRSRRWLTRWLPLAVLAGVALAGSVYWYIEDQGLADDPMPPRLWLWITLTGLACGVAALGWRGRRWWRRAASLLAVPLCLLCAALTLNAWVGYLPTVRSAWERLTDAPLSGQIDQAAVSQQAQQGGPPPASTLVSVNIPDSASGFAHRAELVYLPPAWYASSPHPALPVVMMIGGEFGHPADWLGAGAAQRTIDDFAASHGGVAPVLVFVDYSGAFSNDTECVNGTRGNAADHLTKDVVPYMISTFGVSGDPANWGVVGWSSGGTCALTLAVMHPELFRTFVDIDGQPSPNAGTRPQTIQRLFGGDAEAWASFDPVTVMGRHGPYTDVAAWFAVSVDTTTLYRAANATDPPPAPIEDSNQQEDHAVVADRLCEFASGYGIECAVVATSVGHDFSSAGDAFAAALPWLAGRVGTPGVAPIALPGAPASGGSAH